MKQIVKSNRKVFLHFVSLFILAFLLVLPKGNAAVGDTFTVGQLKYTVLTENDKTKTGTVSVEPASTEITGNVEIPGTIENEGITYSVTMIPEGAFNCCVQLTGIVIPNSITSIGEATFYACSSLISVTIPNSVNSIERSAFNTCSSLTSIIVSTDNESYSSVDGVLLNKNQTELILCPAGKEGAFIIPDGVTSIGEYVFTGCSRLTSIVISDSVTCIDARAFEGCTGLTSITIPNSVISIESFAFDNCSSLPSITIPDSVTSIGGYAFINCNSLTNVVIPDRVSSIGGSAFYNCSSLSSITIPGSVTRIEDSTFYECSSLATVTIPDSVTSIDTQAFAGCSSLTNVVIPDSVSFIGNFAFAGCSSLTNVVIPDSVTEIENAFNGCNQLPPILFSTGEKILVRYSSSNNEISYTIPDTVAYVAGSAFSGCSSLTSITIPDSVTSIGNYAFNGCNNLTAVYFKGNAPETGERIFNNDTSAVIYYKPGTKGWTNPWCDRPTAEWIVLPAVGDEISMDSLKYTVLTVDDKAKTGTVSVANDGASGNVIIPATVEYNGYTLTVTEIAELAFIGSALSGITIPDSVITIGTSAFHNLGLTSVVIPDSVITIGDKILYSCYNLTNVVVGNSVETIGEEAFAWNSKLTSIYFKGNAPETGSRVLHNDNQARVYYNEGTTGWTNPWCDRPTYLYGTILEGDEFTDKGLRYTVLTSNLDKKVGTVSVRDDNVTGHLVIPATVAYNDYTLTVTQIPDEAFRGRSLTSVVIPDTVTSIGYLAFEYNPSLSELTIGNSVTTIGGHAFQNCMELGMVVIPASVTTLGDNAFEGCNSLASVYFEGDAPTAGSNVFLSANRSVIYYGSGTTGWTDPWCDRPAVEIDGVLITDQPQSQTVNVGSTVNFSVTAGGFGALSYQWYKDGSAIAGATSSRYTINNAKASDAGSYTVEVSSADKSVPSDEAVLEVLANSVGDVVTVDNVRYTILTEDTVKISGFESSIGSDIVIEGAIVLGDQSYSVVEIGNRAFNNCQNLQHVVINDGVTKIADQAFFYCRNLLTVEMPDSVVYIGGDGFYGCSSLVSAPLPNYITYLGDAMFGSCTSLQEIIIPATVSEIRAGFAGDCRSLTNLVIGENVTTIAWNAFNDCSSLTTVTIPEKVNFIGLTSFIRCTSLETVEILGSVTTVREQAFAFCPNLEGIYFAGDAPTRYYDNTLEGTDMVTIYYNEGTSGWTNPWYGRPAIVNHGDGLKFTWATPAPIYAGTPLGAEQLNATVNVPGMFTYNPGFGTILDAGTYVLNAAFTPKDGNYKSVSGAVMLEVLPLGLAYTYNANGTATVSGIGTLSEETEIEIPETVEYNGEIYSVTAIGEAAFKDNTTLTHVLIPNSVTSIGSEAFRGCTNLQEMIMPNSVTRINWAAFMDCANLGNLVISENCTYISGSSFERCYALTEVIIPDSVTRIDGSTFRSCNGLIQVTIGNGLTSIDGYVFDLCSNLERVELGTGVNTIQDRAFGGCSKLTKVTFAGNAPASCSGSAFADAPATLYYITGTEGWTDPWNGMPTVAVDLDTPVIITQPASQIAMTEDTVSLTVTAIGSADLSYQWYKDGSAIKGATDPIYTIDSVQMADAGSYAVTVSNGVNSVTSEEATLTVIDSTPTGDPAEDFAYTISGDVVTITGYLGSNEVVTIPNIIERCFVRTLGSASFRANNLIKKVVIPDTVKTIEGRVFLDSQSLESVEIGEGVETIGSWAFAGCVKLKTMVIPDSVTRTDGAFFNNPGLTSIIIGSNVTNFGDTFGLCGNLKSIYFKGNAPVANNIEANATVYYFSGTTGWTDPWCGRPAVEIDGILITEQPQSEILLEGDTVTFSTAVVGIGDLSYQWYKDGEAIKGATGSSYTIASVQMADAGSYAVTVSNGVNSVTSEEATLTVIDSTPIGDPAEDFEYTISGDEVTITGYLGSNEVVTIPNIIEGCLVRTLGSSLFRYNKTITEVVVPNTVKTMGDWVFADCVNLSNVTIPNSVTAIGEHPFIRCNSLIEVTLPDSLTSIGYGAFDSCASLETVHIGNNVTAIEAYAFYNCRNLTAIELPAKVASIGSYAFNSCNSLTSIEVSDDNMTYSSVDGVLFNKDQTKLILCPAGKAGEFNIPNGTLSIEGSAFMSCTQLTVVTIPDSVTSIGREAFRSCTSLQEMIIPDSVTTINWAAFMDCASLENLVISENCTYISGSSFERCYALTEVYIPDSVTQIDGSTFRNCSGLLRVVIGNGLTSIDGYVFDRCSNLEWVELGSGINTIQDRAFGSCTNLTVVYFTGNAPETCSDSAFDDAPATLYYMAGAEGWTDPWYGMPTVEVDGLAITVQPQSQIALEDFTITFSVTAIGVGELSYQWYKDGEVIAGATASSYTIDSVQMADAGSYAAVVSNADKSVTSDEATLIVREPPSGTEGLEYTYNADGTAIVSGIGTATEEANIIIPEIVVKDGVIYTVTGIKNYTSFCWSDSFVSVSIPAGMTSIGTGAFRGCSNLTDIFVDPDNPNYTSVDGILFNKDQTVLVQYPCGREGDYVIPEGVTEIGEMAFYYCSKLTSVTLNDGLETISNLAFYNCGIWPGIMIPDSVTTIGSSAFRECPGLVDIAIGSGVSSIESDTFTSKGMNSFTVSPENQYYSSADNVLFNKEKTLLIQSFSKAREYVIPDGVTEIGDLAFNGSSGSYLTSITIPDSVITIGTSAFHNVGGLTSVVIPDSVVTMGDKVFYACYNITNIVVGSSVETIGQEALYCRSLISVYFKGDAPETGANVLRNANQSTVYYFNGAAGWTDPWNDRPTVEIDGILIQTQPQSQSVLENTSVTFSVVAMAYGELSYQWYKDGVAIAGATASTYTINDVQMADAGIYTVAVDSAAGSLNSDDAVLTVIDSTPTGDPAEDFAYTISGGVVTITGYLGSNDVVTIPNIIEGCLVRNIGDSAFRRCSLTSVTIPDTVISIGYLGFENSPNLTELNLGNSVATIGGHAFQNCTKLTETIIPASVTSLGDNAFEGCNVLTSVYFMGDAPTAGSYVFLSANRSTVYYFSGTTGWTDPWCDRPTVEIDGILILEQPQSQRVLEDATVTFSVAAVSYGELSYQWYKDGTAIAGATDSSYTLNSVLGSDSGSYTAVISNGTDTVTSDEAVLSVKEIVIPTIITQPKSQTVYENDNVTFSVFAGDGSVNAEDFSTPLSDDVDLDMVWIEPGTFIMGSPANELGRLDDEVQHQVTLTQGYWIGKYQVTIEQYRAIMGDDPSGQTIMDMPVGNVTWNDATNFCAMLTEIERAAGRLPEGYKYTLPTEAQWEYACRAGTTTAFNNGKDATSDWGSCPNMDEVGWYYSNSWSVGLDAQPVGQKLPNAWGLYDMHGNVWEWCLDWYGTYPTTAVTDPTGAASGSSRVCRGGGWYDRPFICRSACRRQASESWSDYYGFRVVLAADEAAPGYAYQWFKDGAAIDGATSFVYTISKAQIADSGSYTVTVTNKAGTATSDEAVLTVEVRPATEGLEYEYNPDGTATVIGIGEAYGVTVLVIPETVEWEGTDYTVTSIWDKSFMEYDALEMLVIPDSITSIGNSAFADCSGLTEITIPDSVTSIGGSAFYGCSSLTEITIPNSVTSIGDSAFADCSSLTNIIVSADNVNYSSVDGVFFNKDQTELIQCPGGKEGEFIILNGVISIRDGAFAYCSSLTEITIPDSVTSIGSYAFSECSSLTSITIPDSVISIGRSAFYYCSSLTSATIGNGVTSIGDSAFAGCSRLTSITIPDSVTVIGGAAFYDCYNLTSIMIPDGLTSIGYGAFSGCDQLSPVLFSTGGKTLVRYFPSNTEESYTIPNTVTSIANCAFDGCSSLMSITIPDSVISIGDYAFSWCDSLANITISDSVTSIGNYAFNACSNLTAVCFEGNAPETGEEVFFKGTPAVIYYKPGTTGWTNPWCDRPTVVIEGVIITSQPQSQSVFEDTTATFSVEAIGAGELSYQWYKDGTVIEGATGSSYAIASVQASDEGSYAVTVSDGTESVTSDEVTLSLLQSNAVLTYRYSFDDGMTDSISGADGTLYGNAYVADGMLHLDGQGDVTSLTDGSFAALPADIMSSFGSYSIETWARANSGNASWGRVWDFGNSDGDGRVGEGREYTMLAWRNGLYSVKYKGTEYQISGIGLPSAGTETFTHIVYTYDKATQTGSVYVNGTLAGSARQYGDPTIFGYGMPNMWLGKSNWCDPYFTGDYEEFRIYNGVLSDAEVSVHYAKGPEVIPSSRPVIVTQPQSQTVFADDAVTFSVTAIGAEPLSYQWYKDGTAIAEATDSSYTINSVQMGDAGSYAVTVTNENGLATSEAAVLKVKEAVPPTIIIQPKSQTVFENDSVILSVIAGDGSVNGEDFSAPLSMNVDLDMVWIEPGTFLMGSPEDELGRWTAAEYQHHVTLSQGYWIGKYEVTQAQYETVMGINPASEKDGYGFGSDYPVYAVSWYDALDFCARLTEIERSAGRLPEGYKYTLPTEAQWEYACRAGTTTSLNSGKNITSDWGTCLNMDEVAWYQQNATSAQAVGQKRPNAWGLYDMHGNVWEWCLDTMGGLYDIPETYVDGIIDPVYMTSSSSKVIRGGSWYNEPALGRSANRGDTSADYARFNNGFRVVLTADESAINEYNYQWFKDGVAIEGATSFSYSIGSAQTADAGSYAVTVSNKAGTVTSSEAVLTVLPAELNILGDVFDLDDMTYTVLTVNADDMTGTVSVVNNGATGDLVIPATVEYKGYTLTVTDIPDSAFRTNWNLTSITIPDTVINIGYLAFENCAKITALNIGNSVETIGGHAFQNCTILEKVTIPASVTTLGDNAFEGCDALKRVYFEGDAPTAGSNVFLADDQSTIYYNEGTIGWTNPWCGRPTAVKGDVKQPVIVWNPDSPIIYGTPLNDNQLNAVAVDPDDGYEVGGTYTYNYFWGEILDAGSYTLTVQFTSDDPNYESATAYANLVVYTATPIVTWMTPASIVYGTALSGEQLNAEASVSGYFEYDPDYGTVLDAGYHTLNAVFIPDDPSYESVSVSTELYVYQATPIVTWAAPAAITYGTLLSDAQLNAEANVDGTFAYEPNYDALLDVGIQLLNVTFTPYSANYSSVPASVELIVNQATPTIIWDDPAPITYGTALSDDQLNAIVNEDGVCVYTPSKGEVLDVGTHTLTVTFTPYSDNFASVSKSVNLVVGEADSELIWGTPEAITYGTPLSDEQLNAFAVNTTGTYEYTPAAGTILDAGTHTLTVVFTPDSGNYDTITASVELVVNKANPTITWETPAPIIYGALLSEDQLNAEASVPGTYSYNPGLGAELNVKTHILTVNFTPDSANYNSVKTSVELVVNKATPTVAWAAPAAIIYGTALSGEQLNAEASVEGNLVYTPAEGAVLDVGTQPLTVVFTPDSANYNSVTESVDLVVNQAKPIVTWTAPEAIIYGTALTKEQLNATADVAGTYAYNPSYGTVLGVGTHTLTVTFTPDSANYESVTNSVDLVVNQATPTINWAAPAAITYGTPLTQDQLRAVANVNGSYAYDPDFDTVLSAGTHTLTVVFTPESENYNSVTASVNLIVNKVTPAITWADPEPITYGTALSGEQLNATADVAGKFVYTPAEGTVLDAGTYTLNTVFTPDDTTNYDTATASVEFVVNEEEPELMVTRSFDPEIYEDGSVVTVTLTVDGKASLTGLSILETLPSGWAFGAYDAPEPLPVVAPEENDEGDVVFTWANMPTTLPYTFSYTVKVPVDASGDYTWSGFMYYVASGDTIEVPVGGTQVLVEKYIPPVAPEIVTQPVSQTVTVGESVTFSAAATGTEPLSYQWSKDGSAIKNAKNPSYTISSALLSDAGSYTVTVSNVAGNVTSDEAILTVNKLDPVLTWAVPAPITYGTPLGEEQLNAIADVPGSYVYTPGYETVLGVGTQPLTVVFTPDSENYNSVTASVDLVVNRAVSTITWATPEPIICGELLSGKQLNATANIPGSFNYEPSSGVELAEGTHVLTVLFTPDDPFYETDTASVEIEVVMPGLAYVCNPDGTAIVTGIGTLFADTEIEIPEKIERNGTTYTVIAIGEEAFAGCINLTSITIPASVIAIGDNAFYGCDNLTEVYFKGNAPECNVSVFGVAQPIIYYGEGTTGWTDSWCGCETRVVLPQTTVGNLIYSYSTVNGEASVVGYGIEIGENVIIPRTITVDSVGYPVTAIDARAFQGCTTMKSISLSENIVSIGAYAFQGCSGLVNVKIPETVKDIGEKAFADCINLEVAYVGAGDQNNVFAAMETRSSVRAAADEPGLSIGDSAFKGDDKLKTVHLGENVETIGSGAFSGCESINKITIPDSVTAVGDSAFENCSNLENVEIGENVEAIGDGAFSGCASITEVKIPDSVTTLGNSAFEGCNNLTTVEVGNNVETVGESAFKGCASLTTVTMGEGVTSIDSTALSGCDSLATVAFKGETAPEGVADALAETKAADTTIYHSDNEAWNDAAAQIEETTNTKTEKSSTEEVVITEVIGGGEVDKGTRVAFAVNATGTGLFYQWYKNGTPISGATAKDYVIPSVGLSDAGEYHVAVRNLGAPVDSETLSLEVDPLIGDEITIGKLIYRIQSLNKSNKTGTVHVIDHVGALTGTLEVPPEITLSGYIYDVVAIEAYTFAGCEGLKGITIPFSVAAIGDSTFVGCSALKSIYVDSRNAVYSSVNGVLFDKAQTTLLLCPAGYPESAYIIPNGVRTLAASSFRNCLNLSRLTVPVTVTSIGEGAFSGCSSLASAYYQGNTPSSVGGNIYDNTPAELTSYYERKNESSWRSVVVNDNWQDRRAELIRTKLTVTLPTASATVTYGDEVKLPAPEVEGLIAGDDVIVTAIAEDYIPGPKSPVGSTYDVKASISGNDMRYYDCNVVGGGIVVVTTRPLTITAPTLSEAVVYGSPVPEMKAIIGKELVAGDNVTATVVTEYEQGSDVGSYTTSIGEVRGAENYVVKKIDGKLTVTKADQKITFQTVGGIFTGPVQLVAEADSGLEVEFTSSNPKVLSIEGNIAIPVGNGTVVITAIQEGNKNYNPATAKQEVTVSYRKSPIINWRPAPLVYGTLLGDDQLNATAANEYGEKVEGTFVYNPGAGTSLEVGRQTLFATFTPVDQERYSRVFVSTSVSVIKADQTITLTVDPLKLNVGESTKINAVSTSGLEVVIIIKDENILSKSGEALAEGTVTITATQDGNENYKAAEPVTQTVTVTKKKIITVTVQDETITYGEAAPKYTYTMEPKTEGVEVSLSCAYAKGDDAGSYPITATVTADEKEYTVVTKDGTLTVEQAEPEVTIGVEYPEVELPVVGITYGDLLTDELANAEANVEGSFTYEVILLDEATDTEEVLDIDPTEELVPAGEYRLKATFTPTDSTNYVAMAAYAIFVVEQAVPTVTVEDAGFEFGTLITEEDLSATVTGIVGEPVEGTIEFYVGDIALSELTQPLAVRAYPLAAKFISADPNYADAESEETAWLTVTQSDMGVVTWQPKTEITYGETIALDAVATVNGKELASGNELSYTVKYKGEVYPLEEGAILNAGGYEVRAEYIAPLGGGYADARTEWIEVTVAQAESVITWATPADITDDIALSDAQLNATANVEGTFEYDPAAGTYLEAGTYTLTTVFTPASANYKQATVSVELTVELSIVLELTWETPEPIDYGTPLSEAQLNATANLEGRYFYNPTIGTVLNGGVQKLTVIFKPANKKYKTQYKDVELVVNKLEQTIEFDPIGEVREGDVFILNASTDRELPVRFESSDEEVVKIEGNVATVVGSGTVTITAIQDGNVNYETVSAEQTLVIESEVPQISYEVDLEAGTMILKFTGDLYESEDGVTWTLVEGVKDTYTVDIKQSKMKLYCAGK